MSGLNPSKLPRTAEFVRELPHGLDSFPECQVKASVYRNRMDMRSLTSEAIGALPTPLRELITHPRPVSDWVPEIHTIALYYVVWDDQFDTEENLLRFLETNARKLTNSQMYAPILKMSDPETLLRGVDYRWSGLRKGTSSKLGVLEPGRGVFAVESPPGLWNAFSRRVLSRGIQVALEASGATDPEVVAETLRRGETRFTCTWKPSEES